MIRAARTAARLILVEVEHVAILIGYRVRPYDMLADRRRWCWQRSTRCLRLVPRTRGRR